MLARAKRPPLIALLALALAWAGFIAPAFWMGRFGSAARIDFDVYHAAAVDFRAGLSPYSGTYGMFYLYPPLLGVLLAPLALLPALEAWIVWFILNIAALIAAVALFQWASRGRAWGLLWLSPLLFQPILDSLYIGQVTIFLLLLLTAAYGFHRAGWRGAAGVAIAAAAWLKVWPGLLLLYFLLLRDWRTLRGIVIGGLALALVQVAAVGPETFIASFSVLLDLGGSGQPNRAYTSISVLGFAAQWFTEGPRVQAVILSPALFAVTRFGLSALVLAALAWAALRRPRLPERADVAFALGYSLAVLSAMALSPTLWASGQPPLLVCFWLAWGPAKRVERVVLAAAALLIAMHGWFMIGYDGQPPLPAPALAFGFLGLALLWLVHLERLRHT